MEDEYEEYMDAREERWSPLKNLSPKVIIIFFFIISIFFYFLITGNAKNKDYVLYGGLVIGALILLLKSNTSTRIKYISLTTAMALLLEYHKWYNVLRKPAGGLVRGIALPKGQIEPGHHSKVPHWNVKHPQEWIYWEIGFTIYDEEDNNTPKYFLAKIDPLVGGAGLVDVLPLKRTYEGWTPLKQYFVNPMAVPVEKYFEMKAKGQTTN